MSATQKMHKVGKGNIKVFDTTLTVATAATSATVTSTEFYSGRVIKVIVHPGSAMATSATLKAYEANTPLTTPDYFLNLTFPASEVERIIYPVVDATLKNDGTAVTTARSTDYYICDQIKIDLASATAADSVQVQVYVDES